MHTTAIVAAVFIFSSCVEGVSSILDPAEQVDQYLQVYNDSLTQRLDIGNHEFEGHECTAEDIRVRRSWSDLSLGQRKEYIDAVKCLQEKPARTPKSFASGALNRVDDFTVSHVNQTLFIHFSGWLMPWHRYFIWSYENALREECGYSGYQPYWDWTVHNSNFSQDPLFDGSEYSLGGNGLPVPHGTVNGTLPGVPDPQFVTRPPGTGGGCVVDGPFTNTTLHLGPVFPYGDGQNTGFEYRPHCLTRDFLSELSSQQLTTENVAKLLSQSSMAGFRFVVDAGVHFAGHASIGGDITDVFTSPQDPAFFFHHAQLDRLWAIWQEQDPQGRLYATSDTVTYANSPPSSNATIWDTLGFGYAGGDVTMVEVQDTTRGRLCYRYE